MATTVNADVVSYDYFTLCYKYQSSLSHMSSVGMSIHGSSESSTVTVTILLKYPWLELL